MRRASAILRRCTSRPSPTAAPRPQSCCARATGTARPCESARCLNLSHWPAEHVEGLRGVLKGGVVMPPGEQPFVIERSLPHGNVAAVLGATRAIGLDKIIGPKATRETDPESSTGRPRPGHDRQPHHRPGLQARHSQGARSRHRRLEPRRRAGLGRRPTRTSSTLRSTGSSNARCPIETALAKRHLKGGTLVLYDVSSSYVEGRCCPLAKRGYNRDGKKGKLQIVYRPSVRARRLSRSPSRCSKATPAIPRRSPIRFRS